MKRIMFMYIPLLVIISLSCGSPKQTVTVQQSRLISITGVVTSVTSTDVDKSGKNPRFMLHFLVKIEIYDDGGWETVLGPEVIFVCREQYLLEQAGRSLKPGDRVFITAYIIERSPRVIAVHTLKFL